MTDTPGAPPSTFLRGVVLWPSAAARVPAKYAGRCESAAVHATGRGLATAVSGRRDRCSRRLEAYIGERDR